jgi:hypothetical protein
LLLILPVIGVVVDEARKRNRKILGIWMDLLVYLTKRGVRAPMALLSFFVGGRGGGNDVLYYEYIYLLGDRIGS